MLQADSKDGVYTVSFTGTETFAGFVDEIISMAKQMEANEIDGHLVGWIIKAAYNGEARRQQLRFVTQAVHETLGPKKWDNSYHRRSDDTVIPQ